MGVHATSLETIDVSISLSSCSIFTQNDSEISSVLVIEVGDVKMRQMSDERGWEDREDNGKKGKNIAHSQKRPRCRREKNPPNRNNRVKPPRAMISTPSTSKNLAKR